MDLFWQKENEIISHEETKSASIEKMIILIFKFYNYLDERYDNTKNKEGARNENLK